MPVMVILDEDLIKAAKIAGIEDGRNVSGIVEIDINAYRLPILSLGICAPSH